MKALDLLQHVQPDVRALIAATARCGSGWRRPRTAIDLDGTVRFLGHRDDVPRLLAAADLLVLPSSYEGLPNVVLEAMRFRKPVVATAAPGTTEVVVDGETGLLVPIGDAVALDPGDPRRSSATPALARRLGEAGRAGVEAQFGAESMVDRFAELYERWRGRRGLPSDEPGRRSGLSIPVLLPEPRREPEDELGAFEFAEPLGGALGDEVVGGGHQAGRAGRAERSAASLR